MLRNDRAKVLGSLRSREAVFPEGEPGGVARGGEGGETFSRRFFPDAEGGDLIARFARAAEGNACTTARVEGMGEVPRAAAAWLRGRGAGLRLVCAGDLAELDWSGGGVAAEFRAPRDEDETGATRMVAAAADTGAMLQVSDGGHSLTASLLPPLHLAVLRAEDVLADMESVWARMREGGEGSLPRGACLISGPSRTADIEQTLVLGAHGPLAVHVVIVG